MSLPISRGIGALVINSREEILLLFRTEHRYWECVKGKPQPHECEEETLQRELEEEIGIQLYEVIPGFRQEITYTFHVNDQLMERRVVFSLIRTDQPIRISKEHSEYRWCSFDEAHQLLTHENYKKMLSVAQEALAARRSTSG